MSRSHKDGHGRCGACGDDGEARRDREDDAARADERELQAELDGAEQDAREPPDGVAALIVPREAWDRYGSGIVRFAPGSIAYMQGLEDPGYPPHDEGFHALADDDIDDHSDCECTGADPLGLLESGDDEP